MSHIDQDLITIINNADLQLNSSPSKKVRKQTAKAILSVLDKALNGSDSEKIEAFHRIAEYRISHIRNGLNLVIDGESYYEDEDNRHYMSEEIDLVLFGPNFFDAYNEFERVFND